MAQTDYYGTTARRRRAGPIAMLLIAFLLGIAVAAYTLRNWTGVAKLLHLAPAAAAAPAATVEPQRVVTQPVVVPPPTDAALNERVAEIETRIDAVDAREAETMSNANRAEGLLVSFAARRALDRGQPLGYIEGLLRERFGATDAASVAQVIAASQRPVTLAQLRDGLDVLRPQLTARGDDRSWWQGFRQEVSSLFVVRHADQPSTVPTDRLARADHALDQGQVDIAAAEIARMPGAARANAWLGQARRYVIARNALDRIETSALLTPAPRPTTLAIPTN